MPQGLGKNLYPTLSVFENIDFFGRLFGQSAAERAAPHRGTARRHRHDRLRRPPGQQALRRHEAEARPVLRADPRPRPADPRRAHHRRRSAVAPAVLGAHRPHPRRPPRHERADRHRLHGRGRGLRLAGGGRRRPRARHRHARRAARGRRRRHPGRGLHRPAARGAPARPSSPGDPAASRPARWSSRRAACRCASATSSRWTTSICRCGAARSSASSAPTAAASPPP